MATLVISHGGETKTLSVPLNGEQDLKSLHGAIVQLREEANNELTRLVNEEKASGVNNVQQVSASGESRRHNVRVLSAM